MLNEVEDESSPLIHHIQNRDEPGKVLLDKHTYWFNLTAAVFSTCSFVCSLVYAVTNVSLRKDVTAADW